MAPSNITVSGENSLLPPTWKNLFYPPEKNEYEYFAYSHTHPFLATGVAEDLRYRVRAAWAADAAMLSYAHYGADTMPDTEVQSIMNTAGLAGYEPIGNWKANGTQGLFAWNNDFAILAFRGTERNDPDDVAIDALAGMNPECDNEPERGVEQHSTFLHSLVQAVKSRLDFEGCWVHFGFQCALNQVWSNVNELISTYRHDHPNAEICFTGHSLGAALATLAVSRFTGGNASLYTFGSPRTGNAAFCARVLQRADRGVYRFVNGADLVTHVPIEAPIYHHVENSCHLIGLDGNLSRSDYKAPADIRELCSLLEEFPTHADVLDLNRKPPSELVDHSPARYCMQLRKGLGGVPMGRPAVP
jgi:hypothetical protein